MTQTKREALSFFRSDQFDISFLSFPKIECKSLSFSSREHPLFFHYSVSLNTICLLCSLFLMGKVAITLQK